MKLPQIKIGELNLNIPIIQGGMSVGISMSGLASAVANEGGIGVIGAAGIGFHDENFESDPYGANIRSLKNEIRIARSKSNGIIGVNIMKVLSDFDNLLMASIQEKVDAVFVGAGLPLRVPDTIGIDKFRELKTKIIPIVSSTIAVERIFEFWSANYNIVPDAVVVEGPLAGGHLGFKKNDIESGNVILANIIKDIKAILDKFAKKFKKAITLIAAGGIFTGEDIAKIIENGADGVQMGTRFVGTFECDASDEFKNMYLNSKKEDIILINSPVGLPGRAIRNEYLDSLESGVHHDVHCNWKCLRTCKMNKAQYCIGQALLNAKLGILDKGFAFAGSNAYKVNKLVSVKELIETLQMEYSAYMSKQH